ncbi:TonB-dependent receptor [Microbulbifer hydrolyticus]|uniref:Iron complex outermembrane receptor protein n=1 Tax=Microbulbifer hydrolyticus TaxID=48074 RepID=A0A6P1T7M8_9GAMM|nr:TonB-dependent receptor plug domain-containing protein [Microbulbifer hydrolyticus]MBB5211456.1 iron complex outermembrane receptor protein [Microbulbifer hydrolyticus]QHQ37791.1 TonB-dependent receptor [Microbulbifer hydrolyticus]
MYRVNTLALAVACALSSAVSSAVSAQATTNESIEEVNVTVSPLAKPADAVAAPVSVLGGDELRKAAASTLGQTLNSQLGVANAAFGSGVGLPVIRGQSANRVKVLSDNLDTADASNTSSDHAASIEPLLAESIEILRGPATLRYGSGAIGGVVNVIDGRIPTAVPEQMDGAVEMRHDTANSQDAGVFRLQGGAGNLAWYLDGVYRENGNTRIPGLAIHAHEDHEEHAVVEQHEEAFNTDGFVGNTSARAKSGSAGLSWVTESGFAGLSVNRLENNYGIPLGTHVHHEDEGDEHTLEEGHDEHEEHGAEPVRIDLAQTRYDLKGEHRFNSEYWDKVSFRLGHNNYEHVELEGHDGHFHEGTRFTNDAWESRVEVTHDAGGEWRGAYGLQLSRKDFAAIGEEAFIRPSITDSIGAFSMKEREWGNWHLDLGARLENVTIDPEYGSDRDFNLVALSGALQYFLAEHQHLSVGLTSAERAPVAEELFADGAHLAESRYLIGDANLDKENSVNLELGYHHHNQDASGWHAAKVEANVFYNRIGDYIYAANTGLEDEESEFAIYGYQNRDATFYGAEASVQFPLASGLSLTLFGDSVRASFDNRIPGQSTSVPRLPPLRYGFALGGDYANWNWQWRNTHATAQQRPGAFEETTDAYTRMDLTAQYNFKLAGNDAVVFANARNLLDEEIRNATSLLRDFAPEAGRSIEAGVRLHF